MFDSLSARAAPDLPFEAFEGVNLLPDSLWTIGPGVIFDGDNSFFTFPDSIGLF